MSTATVLTINSGSSSIKAALYRMGEGEHLSAAGQIEGIGRENGSFKVKDAAGASLIDRSLNIKDHGAALALLFDSLKGQTVDAVGHRVVHGGPSYRAPTRVTPELLGAVRKLVPFDPLHLPSEIEAIEAVARLYPSIPQVACFDTAFHATLPEVARVMPLPRKFVQEGIHRYGFHGLSYEYVVEELGRIDPAAAKGRLVVAHLGSGASMSAILGGRCVDTSMGFSPLGGLVMATRCGDLDPGVVLYLLSIGIKFADLMRLLNHESGLFGLSGGISADMRELLAHEATSAEAKLAIDVFCYQARKFIGAYAAALGGLDTLVFTAGIGERSAPIRRRICEGLQYLGVAIDGAKNEASEAVISSGRVTVRVMKTNEELMIARHTRRLLTASNE
jgi:acetate kinase